MLRTLIRPTRPFERPLSVPPSRVGLTRPSIRWPVTRRSIKIRPMLRRPRCERYVFVSLVSRHSAAHEHCRRKRITVSAARRFVTPHSSIAVEGRPHLPRHRLPAQCRALILRRTLVLQHALAHRRALLAPCPLCLRRPQPLYVSMCRRGLRCQPLLILRSQPLCR